MPPKTKLDEILKDINRFVTLRPEHRPEYTKAFNDVRDYITQKLCSTDPVFKIIYNGCRLAGSYADDLKVEKPNEFDLVLHLNVREEKLIIIQNSTNYISFVKILMKDQLDFLQKDVNRKQLYERLQKLTNDKGYLLNGKLQSWIESIFTKVFRDYGMEFEKDGQCYKLRYTKCGPAHTIEVNVNGISFSIDFVPAIKFSNDKWPASDRKCGRFQREKNWIAVPKPIKNAQNNSCNEREILFQTSFVDTERAYIEDKNTLKPSIRLLKKLRDRNNITNLKSYFIKTVFLWETDRVDESFWSKNSLGYVFMYMFDRLLQHVRDGLPFFWYKKCNMLSPLTQEQRDSMYYQLKKLYDILAKNLVTENRDSIFKVFLTPTEQHLLLSKGASNSTVQQESFSPIHHFEDNNDNQPDQNNACNIC